MGSAELETTKVKFIMNTLIDAVKNGDVKEQEMDLFHHFCKGVYARELRIPKGTVLIGKMHRYECINIMLSGDMTIYADGERKRINKPFIAVSPPGTQRAGYAHEDTVWICIHATNSTDLDIIENEFIATDENDKAMLKEIRRLEKRI